MMRSKVVLPEPLGPRSVKNSPRSTAKSTRSTAVTLPKRLMIDCSLRTGSATGAIPAHPGIEAAARSCKRTLPLPGILRSFDVGPNPLPLLRRGGLVEHMELARLRAAVLEVKFNFIRRQQFTDIDRAAVTGRANNPHIV